MVRLDAATERALIEWVENHRRNDGAAHARGTQGEIYLYQNGDRRLIVKAAPTRAAIGWIAHWMLRREHRVYQRLDGFAGAPRCFGFLGGRYLVLEHIDGVSIKRAHIVDRSAFFATLLDYIHELHHRGIAHADLKRPSNLLVIDGRRPCLIDFGAAIVRKPGFAPLNHYLYRLARRFDLNAWVKIKYRGRYEEITPEDAVYFRRTVVEKTARALKQSYLYIKRRLGT